MRIKKFLVLFAVIAGFAVAAPAEPAAAALPACHGAHRFEPPFASAGPVWVPTQYHGLPDGRNCMMTTGYHNWGVYVLQVTLRNCYGQNIAADARFGAGTRQALQNAQRIHRIPDDGVYGPETRTTIMWWTESIRNGWSCVYFAW